MATSKKETSELINKDKKQKEEQGTGSWADFFASKWPFKGKGYESIPQKVERDKKDKSGPADESMSPSRSTYGSL